jgi:hypothetical protein
MKDKELNRLISLCGLREDAIASICSITPEYLSLMKSGRRLAFDKRIEVKKFLIRFIKHQLKLAA